MSKKVSDWQQLKMEKWEPMPMTNEGKRLFKIICGRFVCYRRADDEDTVRLEFRKGLNPELDFSIREIKTLPELLREMKRTGCRYLLRTRDVEF